MRFVLRIAIFFHALFLITAAAAAQQVAPGSATEIYKSLRGFVLDGGSANVSNLVLKRDRGEMTFSGTFYFTKPVLGKVTSAVFIGKGTFRAEAPPRLFERDNLRRMLKADVVESDFQTAVLRFTDDSFATIGQSHEPKGPAPSDAQKLADEFEQRFARETGANATNRLMISLLNNEQPGFFLAQFDKGRRGRFTFLMDYQGRIPSSNFTINGGEKGMIFSYRKDFGYNEVWVAFYSLQDYERRIVSFSDSFNLVDTPNYFLKVDLREPRKRIAVTAKAELIALADGVRAIPFALTEGLFDYLDDVRKKKGMRIKAVRMGGATLPAIQEEWEGGFTVLLDSALKKGDIATLEMDVEGDFIMDFYDTYDCHFPIINGESYPRHGYLVRSKFEITFLHHKRYKVSGPGVRLQEEVNKDGNDAITSYRMDHPVALVTFVMGPYKIYTDNRTVQDATLPVEFFSLPGTLPIKEDFILAEMGNAITYLNAMFGKYPYPQFRAAYHPRGFGRGFASMLAIPDADSARKGTFVFLSHETAHQWWGNIVAWRSYRDQWLSEGFAEYSGLLYMTERTKSRGNLREMLIGMRSSLKDPPETTQGIGSNRVTDIGPIILGQRLFSRETLNVYTILTYNKGALVLRMLHFLFSDPSTGQGDAFFKMMEDFVNRYRNQAASTENFVAVANEHFARAPLAQKYGMTNLKWFFRQWVWQTALPNYRLEYTLENLPDGKVNVKGTLYQENAPQDWVMPMALVFKFAGDRVARGTVLAQGPQQPVSITLPAKPDAVELDPDMWVLSEKTSTKKQ